MIINYPDTVEDDTSIWDAEEEGRCNLILIAARYAGDRSSIPAGRYRTSAGWPGGSAFQGGPPDPDGDGRLPGSPQGALIADWIDPDAPDNRTVDSMEADPDIVIHYRPEEIAEAMLETNYLDPNVFGQGFEPELRDRVFDYLGLRDVGVRAEAEYREQLREIAGVEADAEVRAQEMRDSSRVTEYRQEHTRQDLVTAATILGMDKEKADGTGMIELATFLADRPAEAVRFALEGKAGAAVDVLEGGDGDVDQDFTVEDAHDGYESDELKEVVKAAREGTGEFSLRGATTEDMAAFLVDDKGLTEDEIDAHLMD